MNTYSANFYATYAENSLNSARAVIELVDKLVAPKSVVDIGCGIGTWLTAWKERGITELLGVDGDYVEREQLVISPELFISMDLSQPQSLNRRFDLVESLEVGEHIPAENSDKFVDFLCSLSNVVLFSAAIPFQDGTFHVNEQWPEYWAEKFAFRGFRCIDALRLPLWNREDCGYYYIQNAFLYIKAEHLEKLPHLKTIAEATDRNALARVHPRKWIRTNTLPIPLEKMVREIPRSFADLFMRVKRKLMKPK